MLRGHFNWGAKYGQCFSMVAPIRPLNVGVGTAGKVHVTPRVCSCIALGAPSREGSWNCIFDNPREALRLFVVAENKNNRHVAWGCGVILVSSFCLALRVGLLLICRDVRRHSYLRQGWTIFVPSDTCPCYWIVIVSVVLLSLTITVQQFH